MAASSAIELDPIRADIGHATANLNVVIGRLHSRTGRGHQDIMSTLFSAPEIAALQQHAGQAAQYLASGSARATAWSRSLGAQHSTSVVQCQQAVADEETLAAELSRLDEYMRVATRRMFEQARRLAGTNDAGALQSMAQPNNSSSQSSAQTCLSAIVHVLRIVDTRMQNAATGVGSSRHYADARHMHDRDAEMRSLAGIRTELADLHTHVASECTRISGLASHIATLRRQRAAFEAQNAQLAAMLRQATETRRALDAAAAAAGQMASMRSFSSTARLAKTVGAELQRVPQAAQARVTVESRLLGEIEAALQGSARRM